MVFSIKEGPQLGGRGGTIGGTSWGAVLGMSKYRTPHDIWLRMKGLEDPVPQNQAMRRGIRLEPIVSDVAASHLGFNLKVPGRETVLWPRPYQQFSASLDRKAFDNGVYVGPVELKTMSDFGDWGECGPPEYRLQIQSYIWSEHLRSVASPVDKGWLFCLQASDGIFTMCRNHLDVQHALSKGLAKVHCHEFPRDDVFIDEVVPYVKWWIKTYIDGNKPPPADGSDSSVIALHKHYGFEADRQMTLPENVSKIVDDYREAERELSDLSKAQKQVKERRDQLRVQLVESMQGCTRGVDKKDGHRRIVEVKFSRSSRLDTRALREELPWISEKYTRQGKPSVRVKVFQSEDA